MRGYHKVVGAILALQLVVWVLTGFFFNVKYRYDEAYEQLKPVPTTIAQADSWVSPAEAAARNGIDPGAVHALRLLNDNRGYLYLFELGEGKSAELRLADARTGNPVSALDAASADAALRSALTASPNAARYGKVAASREVTAPSAELGHETAAWELSLETGQTVTINIFTSEISHTRPWNSVIDWAYRIHYMQYTPWKTVNIVIVIVFSLLLLSMVGTGIRMIVGERRQFNMFGRRFRSRGPRLRF